MIPPKLKRGDSVRVVAPSRSLGSERWITEEIQQLALKKLESLGLKVSFSKHIRETNKFGSSSIKSRVEDLHEAFKDPKIKMILTITGGFNSNEVLPYLDYNLIKKNPKILCGYSDITALQNAIYAKTGLVTYSGPHFFSFGEKKGFDYTLEYFKKCLFESEYFEIKSSEKWSNDYWGKNQENRNFVKNSGHYVINGGSAEGTIIGANCVTFHALSGTPFIPSLKNIILFLEDDCEENILNFNRTLVSLTQNPEFSQVKGIVFGRFEKKSKIGEKELRLVVNNNDDLKKIPIIGGVDFGHTTPQITFPIGGKARFETENKVRLEIIEH